MWLFEKLALLQFQLSHSAARPIYAQLLSADRPGVESQSPCTTRRKPSEALPFDETYRTGQNSDESRRDCGHINSSMFLGILEKR